MLVYLYIQIYTNQTLVYTSIHQCILYQYIPLRSAYFTAGFREAHSDAALREVVQPQLSSKQQHDEKDAYPIRSPEDKEVFERLGSNVYEWP
jgi:hypothetical protein